MSKIKMNLPDFITGSSLYDTYFYCKNNYPEVIDFDCEIISIFGCFPNCAWMGGGHYLSDSSFYLNKNIENCVEFYNSNNIPLRLTFTNPLITPELYGDAYGNRIAEIFHNGYNEILTSNINFENYLRDKYPNFKYVRSIIGTKECPYSLDEHIYMTVMRRQKNNDWTFLDGIPQENRHKFEFLCNDPCENNCPRIYSHYRDHARRQMSFNNFNVRAECTFKPYRDKFAASKDTLSTNITKEMALTEYYPKGFINFKLAGRFNPGAIVEEVTHWLIKPEFQSEFRAMTINKYLDRISERTQF